MLIEINLNVAVVRQVLSTFETSFFLISSIYFVLKNGLGPEKVHIKTRKNDIKSCSEPLHTDSENDGNLGDTFHKFLILLVSYINSTVDGNCNREFQELN